MGSKTGEDPDDVLNQHHEMLAAVHSGRSELVYQVWLLHILQMFMLESLFPLFQTSDFSSF